MNEFICPCFAANLFGFSQYIGGGIDQLGEHPWLYLIGLVAVAALFLVLAGPAGLLAGGWVVNTLYIALAAAGTFGVAVGVGALNGGPGPDPLTPSGEPMVKAIEITQSAPGAPLSVKIKYDGTRNPKSETWDRHDYDRKIESLSAEIRRLNPGKKIRIQWDDNLSEAAKETVREQFKDQAITVDE